MPAGPSIVSSHPRRPGPVERLLGDIELRRAAEEGQPAAARLLPAAQLLADLEDQHGADLPFIRNGPRGVTANRVRERSSTAGCACTAPGGAVPMIRAAVLVVSPIAE